MRHDEFYMQGFAEKCAEAGVDPEQLVKEAARLGATLKGLARLSAGHGGRSMALFLQHPKFEHLMARPGRLRSEMEAKLRDLSPTSENDQALLEYLTRTSKPKSRLNPFAYNNPRDPRSEVVVFGRRNDGSPRLVGMGPLEGSVRPGYDIESAVRPSYLDVAKSTRAALSDLRRIERAAKARTGLLSDLGIPETAEPSKVVLRPTA